MGVKICPGVECGGKPFMASSRTVLCRVCSDAADVVIERMTAQGKRSDVIGPVVGLTKSNVNQRQRRLRISPIRITPAKVKPTPKVVVIGRAKTKSGPVDQKSEPKPRLAKPKPGPKPQPRRACMWPSGNPAREMHICCRVPETGDIRCDDAA